MFRRLSAPISVQWELTPACNLNCVHCYNYWREAPSGGKRLNVISNGPSPDLVADEIIKNGIFQVTLTGGEPLTVLKRNMTALSRLRDAGVDLNLNSNLALLNEARISLLKELGIKSALTSLMSFDEATHDFLSDTPGSFRATCAGITKAAQGGLRVAVNMVVTKKNIGQVTETGRFVKQLGAVGFCATKASKPGSCPDFGDYHLSPDELHRMFRDLLSVRDETGLGIDSLEHYPACSFPDSETRTAIGGRNCSAGKTGCTIGFNGQVRPCSHAQQTYGDIADGLPTAWLAMDEWRSGDFVPERCKSSCKEFPLRCGGGCRVEAGNCNGSIAGHDPYCVGGAPPAKLPSGHIKFDLESTFNPSKNLRFRREKGGQVAYLSVKNWLLMDDTIAGLLKSGSGFTAKKLAASYGVAVDRAYPTLRLLVSKKLVSEGGRESEEERR